MHAIERARSARINAGGTKVVEHEIGGAFRRRGRVTADSGYASSAFLLVINDYAQVTTLFGVALKER
jgi:hypothetical protein